MKKIITLILASIFSPLFATSNLSTDMIHTQAQYILQHMQLEDKIGQKIMLDFRYWCNATDPNQACTQDFTVMNNVVQNVMAQNHIGGVILFANNLKDVAQITTLTDAFQQAMRDNKQLPVLIGTDQEGGIVARLPATQSVTFPGNIAIAAATLGNSHENYAKKVGKILGKDLHAVGINVDFAPDVDVNVNPFNPVINVRSFSDDPKLVAKLGEEESAAIQDQNVAATLKHFPGHGDTATDSHLGLPIVNHSLKEAWNIDLYPFKKVIKKVSPQLIMTAHIQYPALDDTKILAGKIGEYIIAPATLSYKIQHDILRDALDYKGIVVTDALDMGAIVDNFDPTDATIKSFQAGDDIALMPVEIVTPDDVNKLPALITQIKVAVLDGTISAKELDESVLRIIELKLKLGLMQAPSQSLQTRISVAEALISDDSQHQFEAKLTDDAVTLVQNNHATVPIKAVAGMRIHILTPWSEQGLGIAEEITNLQQANLLPANLQVTTAKMSLTDLPTEEQAIDNADIVIVGESTTQSAPLLNGPLTAALSKNTYHSNASLALPYIFMGDSSALTSLQLATLQLAGRSKASLDSGLTDADFAYQALNYAKLHGKKTIFISLLAPYDLPNYKDVADAMVAGYDFYGYLVTDTQAYYRGPSMQAITRLLFGIHAARGKLPVSVPNPSQPTQIVYPRGYGLDT